MTPNSENHSAINVEPIGHIDSCYPDKFGTPRQPGLVKQALAKIIIAPAFQPEQSLQGLAEFSHLWIIFQFHKNQSAKFHAKVHPPRLQGETMGVFATRSPHRPNALGLSLVELVSVQNDGVIVRGADIISGTPVIDIKPYLPEVESVINARSGWTQFVVPPKIEIEWPTETLVELEKWTQRTHRPELKSLIEETLKLDPRPTVYKGHESTPSPYRSVHAVRIYEGDIHFQFLNENRVQILKLLF